MSAKTYKIVVQKDIDQYGDLLGNVHDNHVQYLYVQEEVSNQGSRYLHGMVQFKKRVTRNWAILFFQDLDMKYIEVYRITHINGVYHTVHATTTRVPDGIRIQYGKYIPNGGQRIDKDGVPNITNATILEYFRQGGHRYNIMDTFGPDVLKKNINKIHRAYLDERRQKEKVELSLKANVWWNEEAWPWQKEVRSKLERWSEEHQQDKIMVIYDPKGGHGKTTFCKKFVESNPEETVHMRKTSYNNMCNVIYNHVDDDRNIKYCLIDCTAGDEKRAKGMSMFIDCLKGGILRYKKDLIVCPNVQIAIMTNRPLHWTLLELIRWNTYKLTDDGLCEM